MLQNLSYTGAEEAKQVSRDSQHDLPLKSTMKTSGKL